MYTTDDCHLNVDALREYTPPFEEVIERRDAPTTGSQSVGISKNVRRRLTTAESNMPVNASGLPITAEQHLWTTNVTGNRKTADRTNVPVYIIFDRFRNMRVNNIESDYMTHTVSVVRKRPLLAKIPTASGQTVNASRNVRRCLTTDRPGFPVTGGGLPTPSEQHFHTADITRNRDTTNGTTISISIIFDRFWNMNISGLQSNSATHTCSKEHLDILHLIVYQQPLTTLNHAYLCLDAKDCIIRPEIIRFPNSNQETGHWSHLTEEHSRGRTKSAHNEVFATDEPSIPNAKKRKNPQPLSTVRPKEPSSSRNIRRRLMSASSKEILEPNSSRSQDVYFGTMNDSKATIISGKLSTIYAVEEGKYTCLRRLLPRP
ncbi:hypothetical protein Tco_0860536 [Tanacetum coccineum]|uniref:Uncharacterized protein n=1 Tax=Tanacetum coccineum TaxID=301880 RepID=A0ABQ5BKX8_9ASTR